MAKTKWTHDIFEKVQDRVPAPNEMLWDGDTEKLAYGVIHKNLWRFHGDYEPEDLIQEAWGVYSVSRARYTEFNATFVPKEFACYFRTALWRYLLDKAKHDHRRRLAMPITHHTDEVTDPADPTDHFEPTEFDLLLQTAPPDIRVLAERILASEEEGPLSNAQIADLAGGVPPSHIKRIKRAFASLLGIGEEF